MTRRLASPAPRHVRSRQRRGFLYVFRFGPPPRRRRPPVGDPAPDAGPARLPSHAAPVLPAVVLAPLPASRARRPLHAPRELPAPRAVARLPKERVQ